MKFENIKLKDIEFLIKFSPKQKKWTASDRQNHIIGMHVQGSAAHDFGYQEFTIGENCIYFLNQKDDFDVKVIEKPLAYSVHFTTYEPIETDSFCMPVLNPDEILHLLDKIEKQMNLYPEGDNRAYSYFYKLCSVLDELKNKNYTQMDLRIVGAKEYMDMHFKETDCLECAHKISDISRRRFNDLFKKCYNITPNRYITLRKTEFSKNLLKGGNMTIAEVSEACGFGDVYYFFKVFKKETGYTPREFKTLCDSSLSKPNTIVI